MSTHKVEVVRISEIRKHPNADALELVTIWGFTVVVRLGQFKLGELAAYIEPDYVVPADAPWAAHLRSNRIKTIRLRGVWSQGLLIPAPEGVKEGDNIIEQLGVVRYEPPVKLNRGLCVSPCISLAHIPKYDIENWRRYKDLFVPGEKVWVTEKIHGANARFSFVEGQFWCGSRSQWKENTPGDIWWQAARQNPWIEAWCRANEGAVLYGEVFGQVQDLRYDTTRGEIRFRAFDILRGNQWMNSSDFHNEDTSGLATEHRVPVVYSGPYNEAALEKLSMADSCLAKHLAEGIVVKPDQERTEPTVGRVFLKLVSNRYLER